MPYRSTEILPHGTGGNRTLVDIVVLTHDQRHVRRKLLHMQHDDVVMLDLKEPVQLAHGDLLLTETGDVDVVSKALADRKWTVTSAQLIWKAKNPVSLDDAKRAEVVSFLEALDEDDDVQNLYVGLA